MRIYSVQNIDIKSGQSSCKNNRRNISMTANLPVAKLKPRKDSYLSKLIKEFAESFKNKSLTPKRIFINNDGNRFRFFPDNNDSNHMFSTYNPNNSDELISFYRDGIASNILHKNGDIVLTEFDKNAVIKASKRYNSSNELLISEDYDYLNKIKTMTYTDKYYINDLKFKNRMEKFHIDDEKESFYTLLQHLDGTSHVRIRDRHSGKLNEIFKYADNSRKEIVFDNNLVQTTTFNNENKLVSKLTIKETDIGKSRITESFDEKDRLFEKIKKTRAITDYELKINPDTGKIDEQRIYSSYKNFLTRKFDYAKGTYIEVLSEGENLPQIIGQFKISNLVDETIKAYL